MTVVPVHSGETIGPGLLAKILKDCDLTKKRAKGIAKIRSVIADVGLSRRRRGLKSRWGHHYPWGELARDGQSLSVWVRTFSSSRHS